ncbi:hypothetical protein ACYQR9_15410 [Methylobacterium sp. CM6241]
MRKDARLWVRMERAGVEKLGNVRLHLEAAQGVAFQRLGEDRRLRLLPSKHLAFQTGNAAITVSACRREYGEAVLLARHHPVDRLFNVIGPVELTGWLWTVLIEKISQDRRSWTCGEVRRRVRSRWC